jgi:hypothetical protein
MSSNDLAGKLDIQPAAQVERRPAYAARGHRMCSGNCVRGGIAAARDGWQGALLLDLLAHFLPVVRSDVCKNLIKVSERAAFVSELHALR